MPISLKLSKFLLLIIDKYTFLKHELQEYFHILIVHVYLENVKKLSRSLDFGTESFVIQSGE